MRFGFLAFVQLRFLASFYKWTTIGSDNLRFGGTSATSVRLTRTSE